MNDISASIGLVQLRKAEYIYERRLELHKIYTNELKERPEIKIFTHLEGSNFVPFRFSILYEGDRDALSNFLIKNEIEPRTFFYPLHWQPAFQFLRDNKTQDFRDKNFSNSVHAFDHGLCFPVYPELTKEQVIYTCDKIKEYLDDVQ